ncbi:MAG: histidine kinase [Blautia sp.]|nr:histidine kinase [Blautia sp.]
MKNHREKVGMKYRTRMILAYATIALLVSLALGMIVYRMSSGYEMRSRENNLSVSAKSYVSQMNDRLSRMDAIMYYILSDSSMLDSITLLGRASDGVIPPLYVRNARTTIERGISTEYIMENSYRTVFFNEDGFFASSALKVSGQTSANQRLIEAFSMDELDYLEPVIEANGHSVIVGPHRDFWGAYDDPMVFSLMKAPRGYNRQFLEVEMQLSSLSMLESSDDQTQFAVMINGDTLLYSGGGGTGGTAGGETGDDRAGDDAAGDAPAEDSTARNRTTAEEGTTGEGSGKSSINGSTGDEEALEEYFKTVSERIPEEGTLTDNGNVFASASSDMYDVSILTYRSVNSMAESRNRIFLTSFLAALVTFAVSLTIIIIWSNVLVRPVKMLQQIVEETSIDNLEDTSRMEQMDKASGLDEFSNLAHSYQAMTKRLNTALENEKRASMLQLQAQFDTLQTQVNPHFIYNVLNIISSRAIMADDEVICEMCGSLGSMLRYSTNNKKRYASVSEELEYLNSYFYLLKSRYENRLNVMIDVENSVLDILLPKMTLQQIVENSIKHGYHETDENMDITITGKQEADGWFVMVEDNGSGAPDDKVSSLKGRFEEIRHSYSNLSISTEAEMGGIGLPNTFARCLLLFQDDLIFELGNRPGGNGFFVKIGARPQNNTGDGSLS